MKKTNLLLLAAVLVMVGFSACVDAPDPVVPPEPKQILLVCEPVEGDPLLEKMTAALAEFSAADPEGFRHTVLEFDDPAEAEEAMITAVAEGCDLLMAAGPQFAEGLSHAADKQPDLAAYVLLDGVCDNEHVSSYRFREEDLAYIAGIVAASLSNADGQPLGPLGSVHVFQNQTSFAWRWGFMEGARTVNPDFHMDQFLFGYTKEYSDEVAKRLVRDLKERGCLYVNVDFAFDRSLSNIPLEQEKLGDFMMSFVLSDFVNGEMNLRTTSLGLEEGAVNLQFTGDPEESLVRTVLDAAEQIRAGKRKLEVPQEEDYSF